MKVCVLGLWHLGSVTAACLASGGHQVVGLDFDETVIENLGKGQPPLFEPGLEDLVRKGVAQKKLEFTTDIKKAIDGAKVIWVTYDSDAQAMTEGDAATLSRHVNVSPGNGNIRTAAVRQDEKEMRLSLVTQLSKYFEPLPSRAWCGRVTRT